MEKILSSFDSLLLWKFNMGRKIYLLHRKCVPFFVKYFWQIADLHCLKLKIRILAINVPLEFLEILSLPRPNQLISYHNWAASIFSSTEISLKYLLRQIAFDFQIMKFHILLLSHHHPKTLYNTNDL